MSVEEETEADALQLESRRRGRRLHRRSWGAARNEGVQDRNGECRSQGWPSRWSVAGPAVGSYGRAEDPAGEVGNPASPASLAASDRWSSSFDVVVTRLSRWTMNRCGDRGGRQRKNGEMIEVLKCGVKCLVQDIAAWNGMETGHR